MLHYAALAADRIALHFEHLTKFGFIVEAGVACALAFTCGYLAMEWLHG